VHGSRPQHSLAAILWRTSLLDAERAAEDVPTRERTVPGREHPSRTNTARARRLASSRDSPGRGSSTISGVGCHGNPVRIDIRQRIGLLNDYEQGGRAYQRNLARGRGLLTAVNVSRIQTVSKNGPSAGDRGLPADPMIQGNGRDRLAGKLKMPPTS
jgi:hypothetical protein